MESIEIKSRPGLFVTNKGHFFLIIQGRQKLVPLVKTPSGYKLMHNDIKGYLAVNLFVEAFRPDYNGIDNITCKCINNRLLPESIRFVKTINKQTNLSLDDLNLSASWRCKKRAESANQRCEFSITEVDVLNCLKRHDFCCLYCKEKLKPNKWHLDHYIPLSLGGKNESKNLASACSTCNLMKGAIEPQSFLRKCIKIAQNNTDIDLGYKLAVLNNKESKIEKQIGLLSSRIKHQIFKHSI
jgi:hypothetical protein